MKKAILILLCCTMFIGAVSCNFGSKSEIEQTFENIDTTESNFEETDEKPTESGATAEKKNATKISRFL